MPSRCSTTLTPSRLGATVVVLTVLLGVAGCDGLGRSRVDQLIQRQEQLELQVQQLEQRLNRPTGTTSAGSGRADTGAPSGRIKSLTYRSGTSDDRLRIYWADGSVSDLPCTKEQNTLACG